MHASETWRETWLAMSKRVRGGAGVPGCHLGRGTDAFQRWRPRGWREAETPCASMEVLTTIARGSSPGANSVHGRVGRHVHCSLLARATGEHCLQQSCTARQSSPWWNSHERLAFVRHRSWWKLGTFQGSDACQRASLHENRNMRAARPNATQSWEGMIRRSSRRGVACSDQLWMCGSHCDWETLMQRAWMAWVGMRAVHGAKPSTRPSDRRQSITGREDQETASSWEVQMVSKCRVSILSPDMLLSPSDEEKLKERKCRLWTARNCQRPDQGRHIDGTRHVPLPRKLMEGPVHWISLKLEPSVRTVHEIGEVAARLAKG